MHLSPFPDSTNAKAEQLAVRPRLLVRSTILLLALAVALFSYRYLFEIGPIPPNIANNRFRPVWLVTHVSFAATALLVGAVQFSGTVRRCRPWLHRWVGRTYATSCLFGGVAGLILAIGSSGGPIASAGFGSLGLAWVYSTALGWQRARTGDFASHRRWMIRSWALTLAAVTLRIYLPLSEMADLPELPAYGAISFLCWMPNLLVAEFVLRREDLATLRAGESR
jgi:uncharacterized membrane protein